MTIAGLSNLATGNFRLGGCRLGGVFLAVLAAVLIMPAYSEAARSGGFSFLFLLVYAPLGLGEFIGRVLSERALQAGGMRMRSLSGEGPVPPPAGPPQSEE